MELPFKARVEQDPEFVAGLLQRLKQVVKSTCGTQTEFARKMRVDISNVSKYLNEKLPVSESFLNRVITTLGISREWLYTGMGEMLDENMRSSSTAASGGIPVYDVDVTAGNYDLDQIFTEDRIIGYISLPKLNKDNLIVHVSGDSMEPEIPDGSYLAIKQIPDFTSVLYGQTYVVMTEDFRRVKHLRRHPEDPDRVVLHSANPNYDDIDIHKSQIKKLFCVNAVLNCRLLG